MRRGVVFGRNDARRRRRIVRALAVTQHRKRIDRIDFGPASCRAPGERLCSARRDDLGAAAASAKKSRR